MSSISINFLKMHFLYAYIQENNLLSNSHNQHLATNQELALTWSIFVWGGKRILAQLYKKKKKNKQTTLYHTSITEIQFFPEIIGSKIQAKQNAVSNHKGIPKISDSVRAQEGNHSQTLEPKCEIRKSINLTVFFLFISCLRILLEVRKNTTVTFLKLIFKLHSNS